MVVLITTGSADEARALARLAVERKLAACVQFLPMQSVYEWEGTVQEDAEYLVLFKTHRDVYARLEAMIAEQHSYDVPEIIALPIAAGLPAYMQWIGATTGATTQEG
jgi:periplasmic divalent cation tolerance protein